MKYNLTSNLILDLTANTDFAQVEVDDQRINTTRFSLFFPEKRDFFQERADLFRFRFPGGTQRLFQSRRIGIVSGQTVPILGGVRMTGRLGAWELGFIEMQTDKVVVDEEEIASENFGVIRVQREAFERGSFIGGMVTSRTDFKGTYNVVVGADCDIRMLGPQYLKIQAGQSMEPGSSASQSRFASVTVQRRIRRGFSFGTSIGHYGSEFNPAVGFINRLGINRFGARTQYTWFPASKHILQNHTLTNRFSFIWGANSPHELETFDTRFSWDGLFKSGARANASLRFRQESIVDTFSVGEVDIIPSKYDFLFGEIRFGTPTGDALRFDLEGGAGGFFGGKQFRMELSPSWSVDKHLAFKFEYEYNRIKVGRQLFNAHLTRLRVRSAFNHALSINAFVQYNSESAELAMNIRLRYNPVEGSDFYLVFNENVNTLLDPEIDRLPQLPRTQSRAILLKYNYTFIK